MEFIKKNWHKLILLFYTFIVPFSVIYADISDACPAGQICNPLGANGPTNLPAFIQTFLTGVLRVGIPIVALAIIYCGFLFVKARGKSEELTKAKDALLYTLIGAAILLGSYAIATMISGTVLAL